MYSTRLRYPGGKAKAFTLSYDDGVQQDVRLIEIMRKNGIKGTFNLNSGLFAPEGTVYPEGQTHRRMTLAECQSAYNSANVEVAVHSYTHPFLDALPQALCTREIIEDRRALERAFGVIVRGAAYPFGTTNADVVYALRACGIAYCRTVVSTHSFKLPTDWLNLPATCHHADSELNRLADAFITAKPEREPMLFYLWGHSYEFEQTDSWQLIEDFLARIGGRDDIWYATNIEIYDCVKAFEALIWSADGARVYNPTAREIWFEADKQLYMIGAGETLSI